MNDRLMWLWVTLMSFDPRRQLAQREEGQGLTEYVMILIFVAIVCIVGLILYRNQLTDTYSEIVSSIPD
ncbi:MAG: Flp family type IVb pilin [Chloroflexota bacterium]